MKANKSNERPSRVIFFDIETSQRPLPNGDIAQDFRYGTALYWRRAEYDRLERLEWYEITDISAFWSWVWRKSGKEKRLILTSHNLNVDMVGLDTFQELQARGMKLKSFYIEGATKILRFRGERRTLLFLDNANWWKVPLATLGDMVGYPKLTTNPLTASLEDLKVYCKRDTEILYQVWSRWIKFLDAHNLGNWGITIASQSMKAYTHRFMRHTIYIHDRQDVIDLERQSYHGGRVEAFWLGEWEGEKRYKLDVNSMYPYVMATKRYPTRLIRVTKHLSILGLKRVLKKSLVTLDCELDTDIPVYCVVGEHGAYYPVGCFRTVLTTGEVRFALSHGHITKIYQCAIYDGGHIFADYVDYFYGLKSHYRDAGNESYAVMSKYMLNTLYGKFGQKGSRERVIGECDADVLRVEKYINADTGEWGTNLYIGGSIIQRVNTGNAFNSFVAIAAHVTGYARIYLWELIEQAGRDHVYYVDTDCLVVDNIGYSSLRSRLSDSRLGALKVEAIADNGSILGRKDYRLAEKTVLKGIPKKATTTDGKSFHFLMWPSMKRLLREGDLSQYYVHPTTRTLKRKLTWASCGRNGWLLPFRLPEHIDAQHQLALEIADLREELRSLLENRLIPHKLTFTMWDYREGEMRKGAYDAATAPVFHGVGMETVAAELGYYDWSGFIDAIHKQIILDDKIRVTRRQLKNLLSLQEDSVSAPPCQLEAALISF